ncbi:hypothetical protein ATANTOWER_005395, partial [Ataeniobius toweri]|nr:hypothetical protein [Ataeniobius toweri]
NLLGVVVEQGPTAKLKHSETTVPLQLVGQKWKPVSELKSQSHPVSLKLSVEVEGEQLVLALEKN